jgi:hypothetical protein
MVKKPVSRKKPTSAKKKKPVFDYAKEYEKRREVSYSTKKMKRKKK